MAIFQFSIHSVSSLTLKKAEENAVLGAVSESDAVKHSKKHTKTHSNSKKNAPGPFAGRGNVDLPILPTDNSTNTTLSSSIYLALNNSFHPESSNTFTINHRKWDYKMIEVQIQDIYADMTAAGHDSGLPEDRKAFLHLFIDEFEGCDKNGDNELNITEFAACMKNDTDLSVILVPTIQYAAYINYTTVDPNTGFYGILFNILDNYHNSYLNFHDYMFLRLLSFSWRKCSVMAPFIEEVGFECAIEIVGGSRTLPKSTVKNLFQQGIQLSNSQSIRNLDFISFTLVASSVRLFGKINGKGDNDITRNEFELALDKNILPIRYSPLIIEQIYRLVERKDGLSQGIDVSSFCFYDFFLRMYDQPTPERKWFLNQTEFVNIFKDYLFPNYTLLELEAIPQNLLSNASYQMYTYSNITNFNSENDFLMKSFLETDSRVNKIKAKTEHKINITQIINGTKSLAFNPTTTYELLFKVLDNDNDGFLTFYDFGNFIQIAHIFTKEDMQYHKGRLLAGDLAQKYGEYSGFPIMSYSLEKRAHRFKDLPQDLYVDLYSAVLILRIDDIVDTVVRRGDKSILQEAEMKTVLNQAGLSYVPDRLINMCLRGMSSDHIPEYDWECAFGQAILKTLQYYESSFTYMTAKAFNITLFNTMFFNADPALAGTATAAKK